MELFVGQTDMEIQPQGTSSTGDDRLAWATPIDTPDELTDQPAIGDSGITVLGARRPPGASAAKASTMACQS